MPEMFFTAWWPDGSAQRCHPPSPVIEDHPVPGAGHPVDDFVERNRTALREGSERVRSKSGFACGNALGTVGDIRARAAALGESTSGDVPVEGLQR